MLLVAQAEMLLISLLLPISLLLLLLLRALDDGNDEEISFFAFVVAATDLYLMPWVLNGVVLDFQSDRSKITSMKDMVNSFVYSISCDKISKVSRENEIITAGTLVATMLKNMIILKKSGFRSPLMVYKLLGVLASAMHSTMAKPKVAQNSTRWYTVSSTGSPASIAAWIAAAMSASSYCCCCSSRCSCSCSFFENSTLM
mmetsp:Transcript_23149/g.48541  ORF Transcript_23149/g.48541 Transcript_23149/m.48541 type:complete len:200 (-) Transcript_23149:498-1097(-)